MRLKITGIIETLSITIWHFKFGVNGPFCAVWDTGVADHFTGQIFVQPPVVRLIDSEGYRIIHGDVIARNMVDEGL